MLILPEFIAYRPKKNLQWPSDAVTFMATEGLTPFLAWGVPVPVDLMVVFPGRAAALCVCVCVCRSAHVQPYAYAQGYVKMC